MGPISQSVPKSAQVVTAEYKGPMVRSVVQSLYAGDQGAVLQHPSGYGVVVRLKDEGVYVIEGSRRHSMAG